MHSILHGIGHFEQSLAEVPAPRRRIGMKRQSYRSVSIHHKFRLIYIAIPAALVLAALIVLYLLFANGFFYKRHDIAAAQKPLGEEIRTVMDASRVSASDLAARTSTLLKTTARTDPYVVSWYMLPGSIKSQPALSSEYLLVSDQILLLRSYIASGKKDAAKSLADSIEEDFTDENGYLVPCLKSSEVLTGKDHVSPFKTDANLDELPAGTYSFEDTVAYLRALLEYYAKWGSESDWTRINAIAGLLASDGNLFPEDLTLIGTTPAPVITGEKSDVLSLPEDQIASAGSYSGILLSGIDLEVFRMLAVIDTKYQPLYDKAVEIVSGGYVSQDLPLFAYAYTQSTGGYTYTTGKATEVDLVSSLRVILHLAEEGQAPAASLAWIKEQLYNQGVLYKTYDVISGEAISEEECTESYGIVLQIARAADDPNMFDAALSCAENHLATKSNSTAVHSIFRNIDSSRIAVYAKDNLEVLLGVL